MSRARTIVLALMVLAAATLMFRGVAHQLSSALLEASLRPELRQALEKSMADQKRLRALDPQHAADYRARFDEVHRLAARIDVLRLNREELLRRYELILTLAFLALFLCGVAIAWLRHRRNERRLTAIQSGLEELSRGATRVVVGDGSRDVIGRIGRMIEQTANVVSRQRQRIESLQHLSYWQEAARRHAHEIRTPVTAARLEVERLATLAGENGRASEAGKVKESALEELDRLARYTAEFSSFARLPVPVRRPESVAGIVEEFCRAFGRAWPNLTLQVAVSAAATALVDRDMLRQVLANLCTNSSLAAKSGGMVTFTVARENGRVMLDVADDGCGIDPSIRPRLFQPYATTRRPGEGMGLGLAISRKIMLDHDGDLELVSSSGSGTTFRLTLPAVEENS